MDGLVEDTKDNLFGKEGKVMYFTTYQHISKETTQKIPSTATEHLKDNI